MKIVNYGDEINENINIALGFFDAVHYGHARLIAEAADEFVKTAVCIFDISPSIALGKSVGELHILSERLYRLENAGVDYAIVMHADSKTMSIQGAEFVKQLIDRYRIGKTVIGEDYACGKNGAFTADEVKYAAERMGIECVIVPLLSFKGADGINKISSSSIAEFIKNGKIAEANALMPLPYMITGRVLPGRQVGGKEVYPTANIQTDSIKILPLDGVYTTCSEIDGKRYKSITNIGCKPTFNEYTRTIETYVLGYNGDLYGKTISVFVVDRIRGVIKFADAKALKKQIDADIDNVNKNDYLSIFIGLNE